MIDLCLTEHCQSVRIEDQLGFRTYSSSAWRLVNAEAMLSTYATVGMQLLPG